MSSKRSMGSAPPPAWHGVLGTAELDAAFKNDTNNQLGLSILRVDIDPADSRLGRRRRPMPRTPRRGGVKYVLATPWTPPASMKTNNNTVAGELKTTSYADYAAYLKSFYQYMGNVDVISVQNEPNIKVTYLSATWSATPTLQLHQEQRPRHRRTFHDAGDLQNYDTSYSDSTLNDSVAASNVDYIGLHLYGRR